MSLAAFANKLIPHSILPENSQNYFYWGTSKKSTWCIKNTKPLYLACSLSKCIATLHASLKLGILLLCNIFKLQAKMEKSTVWLQFIHFSLLDTDPKVMVQNKLGCTQLNWWANKYLTFHKYWHPVIPRVGLCENYIRFLLYKTVLHLG